MYSLRLKDLAVSYKRGRTLHYDCPLVEFTKCLAVMGPSGCGKTTLLRVLSSALHQDHPTVRSIAGRAFVDAVDVTATNLAERRFCAVRGEGGLFHHLTCRQNILLPGRVAAKEQKAGELEDVAHAFGIEDVLDQHPRGISSGQKTRVALAQAIIQRPTHLFLDEVFSTIDLETKTKIVSDLATRHDGATLLVTHDPIVAGLLADKVLRIGPNGRLEDHDDACWQATTKAPSMARELTQKTSELVTALRRLNHTVDPGCAP